MPDDRLDGAPSPKPWREGPDAIRGDAPAAAVRPDLQQTLALRQPAQPATQRAAGQLRPAPAINIPVAPAASRRPQARGKRIRDRLVPRRPGPASAWSRRPPAATRRSRNSCALTGGLALAGAEAVETKALEARASRPRPSRPSPVGRGRPRRGGQRHPALPRAPAGRVRHGSRSGPKPPRKPPRKRPWARSPPPTTVLASLPGRSAHRGGDADGDPGRYPGLDLRPAARRGAGAYLALRRRGSRGSPTWRRSRPRRSRPGSGPLGRLVPAARWIETARAAR